MSTRGGVRQPWRAQQAGHLPIAEEGAKGASGGAEGATERAAHADAAAADGLVEGGAHDHRRESDAGFACGAPTREGPPCELDGPDGADAPNELTPSVVRLFYRVHGPRWLAGERPYQHPAAQPCMS